MNYTKYSLPLGLFILLGITSCGPEKTALGWETATINEGTIEMIISASGSLKATNTVEVGSQVSGVIAEVFADFNDEVKAGQIIAQLDDRQLLAAVQQAQANVQQAEVQLAQRQRAYENAQRYNASTGVDASVREAQANLEQINAQLEVAEKNYQRYENLYQHGAASLVEFENKKMEYNRLQANYNASKSQLDRSQANVSAGDAQQSKEELQVAKASLSAAQASLTQARVNLENAAIRSPIDGVVLSRTVEKGQTVAASFQTPVLFTIARDLTKMEIESSIDEADIGLVKVGQSARFTVDAYAGRAFSGKVSEVRLQPEVISNVVIYTVLVTVENDDLELMPGMTANLDVAIAKEEHILRIPTSALTFRPPAEVKSQWQQYLQSYSEVVWLLVDQTIQPQEVTVGLSDGRFVAISGGGLKAGDKVIIGQQTEPMASKKEEKATSPFIPKLPQKK